MLLLRLSQSLALLSLIFAVVALALRTQRTRSLPLAPDRAPAKGSLQSGVRYAFTLGMMPWAKESTRRHMLAYLRGVAFHGGIFAGLAALLFSPWWTLVPAPVRWGIAAVVGLGALFGLLGEVARWFEHTLRAMSTPDDHAAVLLVTVFLAATCAALLDAAWLPAMYLAAALMLFYVPLGKIRHCIYFFFSRRFFGSFIGRRAVIHAEVTR